MKKTLKIDPRTPLGTINRSRGRLQEYLHMARIFEALLDPLKIAFMLIFTEIWGPIGGPKIAKKQHNTGSFLGPLFGSLPERPGTDFS